MIFPDNKLGLSLNYFLGLKLMHSYNTQIRDHFYALRNYNFCRCLGCMENFYSFINFMLRYAKEF